LHVFGALSIHYRRYLIHGAIALLLPERRPRFKDQGSQTSAPSITSPPQADNNHLESLALTGLQLWRTSSDVSMTGFCACSGMPTLHHLHLCRALALMPDALLDISNPHQQQPKEKAKSSTTMIRDGC
jgi:hypothetical protein